MPVLFTKTELRRIQRIPKAMKWTWLPVVFMLVLGLGGAIVKFVYICNISNFIKAPILEPFKLFFQGPQVESTYQGIEVILLNLAGDVFVYLTLPLVFVLFFLLSHHQDKLLLKCWNRIQELEESATPAGVPRES